MKKWKPGDIAARSDVPPWQQILDLFDSDIHSLPDVFVDGLTPDQAVAVYEWVMSQCRASEDCTVWYVKEQKDLPISSFPTPARAYVAGEIEPFRHGLVGLSINGVELPYLTICMESIGSLSFDYQKGPKWNEITINAFLELLVHIRKLAPHALIWHAEEGHSSRPTPQFAEALLQFEIER
ncbi:MULTISPECIES: hypothetical protein [unclassified Burkholderia]|uniref:hypothetical protein n=1 Tax=unclassified Burkholderia TaxID=2613784 RepID=UPI001589072D|nr:MULTISPECIES: hypothetical protein [unclassified Burkholderia]